MRHRINKRKLNRTSEHRRSLRRHLAQSLFEHGRICTTLPKAKDARPFCEKLITLAVKVRKLADAQDHAASLAARRRIERILGDRSIIDKEHQAEYDAMSDAARAKTLRMKSGRRYRTGEARGRLKFTSESVIYRLIEKVAPRFMDRSGGYTRIVRLAPVRLGDAAPQAVLQLVGDETSPGSVAKPGPSARRRRADARYALAVATAKGRGRARGGSRDSQRGDEKTGDDSPPEEAGSAADST